MLQHGNQRLLSRIDRIRSTRLLLERPIYSRHCIARDRLPEWKSLRKLCRILHFPPSVGSFRSGMVSTIRPQLFRLPSPVESPFQSTRLQKLPLPCTGTRHRTNGSDCYRCNRIYIISGRRRCRHSLYHRRLLSYGSFPPLHHSGNRRWQKRLPGYYRNKSPSLFAAHLFRPRLFGL